MTNNLEESIVLHSGNYVEKYDRKPIDRVANLTRMMKIGEKDKIADYACGNGMLLETLPENRGHYDGVDFSQDFINSANRRAIKNGSKNYEFHCQDIVEFCSDRKQMYDIAATLDFSEHILDDMFVDIYSAIRSSLKDGGRLYIHTPNLGFLIERFKDIGIMKQFPEHIGVRTGAHYQNLLLQCGFKTENINIKSIPHYNILKNLHVLRHLPVAGKLFEARLWIVAQN